MDVAETVQAIFSVAVSIVVLVALWVALRGGDFSEFAATVSQYAQAFVVALVVLFFVLWAGNQLS